MNYVPKGLSRLGHRQLLKLQKNSPTILVVTGVVGLGATAILAAKATRNIDPILEDHAKERFVIDGTAVDVLNKKQYQKDIVRLYSNTSIRLSRLYAPTLVVGTLSAGSVLYGHRILKGRHMATMMAFTGLMDQHKSYRARVAETIGAELERDLHNGAVGKYEEDPEHPGEFRQKAKFIQQPDSYLRPFFDEANSNWTPDPSTNQMFLRAVQNHMNRKLEYQGHLFLFDVYDALGIPRVPETIVTGWLFEDTGDGDGYVDFGFMTDQSPEATLFRNAAEPTVRLNFNIDGVIWEKI